MEQNESGNSAADLEFWRQLHREQAYVKTECAFEEYAPAYRTGVEGFRKYSGQNFVDVEGDLARDYERSRGNSVLPWDHARHAVHAAWAKLSNEVTPMSRDRGLRTGF